MQLGLVVAWTSVVVGAANLGLLAYLRRLSERPGLTWFQGVIAAQTVFCAAYGVGLLLGESPLRDPLLVLYWVAAIWIGVAYLGFALVYTGRARYVHSRPFQGIVGFQSLGTLVVLTYPFHDYGPTNVELVEYGGVRVLEYTHNAFVVFEFLTVVSLATLGVVLLIDTVVSYGPLYRKHALAIAVTPLPPTVAFSAWLLEIGPFYPLNLTAIAFFPHLVLDLYALFGEDMFEFPPATRRRAERAAVEDLGNPVVVVDPDDRIVRLNAAAVDALGVDETVVLATDISRYLEPVDDGFDGDHVRIADDTRARTYARTRNPLDDGAGGVVGYTVVLQDVTAERRREQRVGVLNRVLRHNLRNDLTVVLGSVTAAAEASDDPAVVDLLETAADQTRELSALGERAREVEATMSGSVVADEVVDAHAVLEAVRDDVTGRHPAATVDVDVPHDCRVTADPDVLRVVFENLVENGVVHDDGDPRVSVAVTNSGDAVADGVDGNGTVASAADGGTVTFAITDTGPGIPGHELDVLDARESALEHGSGLGLFVVNWGVSTLGGDVTFDATDDGTRVLVTLPGA
ncbi:histidine kinase N-terminal 7TM domain-containing protein [Halorubellus litoreus]|uniref:histidine kinase n=1 Tax=Halorubellus litoreus TaxID=755308 RepID=A0ABD5VL35_9EURY